MTEGGDGTCGFIFTEEAQIKRGTQKSVIQLDMSGNKIEEYENIHIASRAIDGSFCHISSCCNCRYGRKSHKGFLWMFKIDYDSWDRDLNSYYDRFEKIKTSHPKPKPKTKHKENKSKVAVDLYNDDGVLIKKYRSIDECKKEIGISYSSLINSCKNKTNIRKNINIRYANDDFKSFKLNNRYKSVSQYDLNGEFIRTYNSIKEASEICGFSKTSISDCCRGIRLFYNNYFWIYHVKNEKELIKDLLEKYSLKLNTVKRNNKLSKPISQYDLNGKFIKMFEFSTEAQEKYGKSICNCASGNCKSAYGFIWAYKTDKKDLNTEELNKYKSNYFKQVNQYDLNMNYISTFYSIKEAENITGIRDSNITSMLKGRQKTAGGYIWKYVDEILD